MATNLSTDQVIILKRIDKGQRLLLFVLSERAGKLGLAASDPVSRLVSEELDFSLLEARFTSPDRYRYFNLQGIDLRESYRQAIMADKQRRQAADKFCAWLNAKLELQAGGEYFQTLRNSLFLLSHSQLPDLALVHFYLRAFRAYGVLFQLPDLDRLIGSDGNYSFSSRELAFRPQKSGKYTRKHIKAIMILLSLEADLLLKFNFDETVVKDLSHLVRRHPDYYL